jgi:hypothetical protein
MKIDSSNNSQRYLYSQSKGQVKARLIRNIWQCVRSFFKKSTPLQEAPMPPHLEILDPTHIEVLKFNANRH